MTMGEGVAGRPVARMARLWTNPLCRRRLQAEIILSSLQKGLVEEKRIRNVEHVRNQTIDTAKLDALISRAIGDLSAGYGGVMVSLGNRLGLYRAMAAAGPLTSWELASRAGCAERYVREWLGSQVAGGYVDHHANSNTFELTPEQALVLANEDSPVFIPNAWAVPASMWADEEKAIEGVVDKLDAGGLVADVGCGHGHSTVLMAKAFPKSRFFGFDNHERSVTEAATVAAEARVAERTSFSAARAEDYPGTGYDLICFFDCLHDMGDPVAAARHAARALAPDGTVMLVEPFANDRVEDNVSPVARMYYAASTTICCAHAISDGGHMVLGAQAGQARLADVFRKAGFTRFRRAMQTPFNLILEAKL